MLFPARTTRLCVVLAGITLLVLLPPARAQDDVGHYRGFGDATGFRNILPPGEDGSFDTTELLTALGGGALPPHATDQVAPYAELIRDAPGLTEADVDRLFKDASFGVRADDIERVYQPRPDVTVVRDKSFGVAHIFGSTRDGTEFANGYTSAEDRLFFMDALRHVGEARLSEFVGGTDANQAMDRGQLAVAPYTDGDLTAQVDELAGRGAVGQQVVADIRAYVAGVNQFIDEALLDPTKLPGEYPLLQKLPSHWRPEDVVSVASLVGGILGRGGGGELRNECGLQQMTTVLGATEARNVFDDLHFGNDPESPTTSTAPMPYLVGGPVDPSATPAVDCGSLVPVDTGAPSLDSILDAIEGLVPRVVDLPTGPTQLAFPTEDSNAILVSGSHTTTGSPIAVMGPQVTYRIPEILVEKDIHGPGIDARGAAFPGADVYVQLGRGPTYAWSATSASADNTDQFVVKLCDPNGGAPTTASTGYLVGATCRPIEAFDHTQIAAPTVGGIPNGVDDLLLNTHIERTADYGPLVARGTLRDGTPIAVTTKRSTYGDELGSAIGFEELNDPQYMAHGYDSFRAAAGSGIDYTFNWFYVDAQHIGYQHSCRCPQRAVGVDPYLPPWGDGRYDWNGWLSADQQPHQLDPPTGYFVSWNNRPAPEWGANDADYSWGPVYRSLALERRITAVLDSGGKFTRASFVDVMADAATVDTDAAETLPELLAALGPTAPVGVDPRAQVLRDRLATWLTTGAHRRDHDGDGAYDDPYGPAAFDAWFPLAVHAIFDGPSGGAIDALHIPIVDAPQGHRGTAYDSTMASHVDKDLRAVLGAPEVAPWHKVYCGGGDAVACRTLLWSSLASAAASMPTDQRTVADDAIHFDEVAVTIPDIPWQNRPTFQQVVQLPALVPGSAVPAGITATAPEPEPLPATGGQPTGALVGALLVLALVSRRAAATLH